MSKLPLYLFFLLLGFSLGANAQTREQCQRWSDQYQHYAEQRRAGGTLAEMDRWRDRQRQIEAQMREARCMQRFRITTSESQVP